MIRRKPMFLALLMVFLLSACAAKTTGKKSTIALSETQTKTPFEQIFKGTAKTVFEDEGKFILIEGSQCVQQDTGTEVAAILQSIEMPNYVDSGTVVLNGWKLRYLHVDREVHAIRADITHSKLVKGSGSTFLVFEAQGKLADQKSKDAYEFCVFYSGFGYHADGFDATIDNDYTGVATSLLQNKNQGAVATLENTGARGFLKSNDLIAIIPRGFGFQYDDIFECELRFPPCKWGDRADYRLLHMAYHLSQTGTSPNQDGSPYWAFQTIFKDNHTRTHQVEARAAMIRGSSVKLRTDFLALNPRAGKTPICRKRTDGVVRTQTFRIQDVPYDYAVPMLTGWDLSFECEHQRVQQAGIWLHDIRHDPNSNSVEYKVSAILRDQDGAPSFNVAHRVTVLGLNRVRSSFQQRIPDLNIKIREH